MKRIVRLTESDLTRIVKRVISEGTGVPIPKEGFLQSLKSAPINQAADGSTYVSGAMALDTKAGGYIRKSATPGVVEFDAVLKYEKWYGGKYAGKAFPVLGYYGCKSNRFTAGDFANSGKATVFEKSNMGGIQTAYFIDAAKDGGLCN
jgi:hypothetical protein